MSWIAYTSGLDVAIQDYPASTITLILVGIILGIILWTNLRNIKHINMKEINKKGRAVKSLIFGISTIILFFISEEVAKTFFVNKSSLAYGLSPIIWMLALIIGIVAIIFGVMGMKQSKEMSIAGIIMGFIPLTLPLSGIKYVAELIVAIEDYPTSITFIAVGIIIGIVATILWKKIKTKNSRGNKWKRK